MIRSTSNIARIVAMSVQTREHIDKFLHPDTPQSLQKGASTSSEFKEYSITEKTSLSLDDNLTKIVTSLTNDKLPKTKLNCVSSPKTIFQARNLWVSSGSKDKQGCLEPASRKHQKGRQWNAEEPKNSLLSFEEISWTGFIKWLTGRRNSRGLQSVSV